MLQSRLYTLNSERWYRIVRAKRVRKAIKRDPARYSGEHAIRLLNRVNAFLLPYDRARQTRRRRIGLR